MLIDPKVEIYVEKHILPQQNIRRHADGSIDYTFYDRRARNRRGVAVRAASRSAFAFVLSIIGLLAEGRPKRRRNRQSGTSRVQTHARLRRRDRHNETATISRKTFSEAA